MTSRAVVISCLLLLSVASAGANEVIGTVEFTLDGEEQTWYVLKSPEGLTSNALWLQTGPESAAIAVTAFQHADIELTRDERTGSTVPSGSAPALVVSIEFPTDATEVSYTLPVDPSAGQAVVMLLNDWSNPLDSRMLSDGPGEISLDSISVTRDGPSAFSGRFSGALDSGDGNTRSIESGRFEFEDVTYFERP